LRGVKGNVPLADNARGDAEDEFESELLGEAVVALLVCTRRRRDMVGRGEKVSDV